MSQVIDTGSEEWRRICEARTYLRELAGDGEPKREDVDALIERIGKRRGQAAAGELRQEMRRQWSQRRSWQGGRQA